MEDITKAGIYMVLNIVNYKVYVGRTIVNFNKRWNRHKSELNNNKHYSRYLQYSWNKYKENNFEFLILEEIDRDNKKLLNEREYYWINKLEAHKKEFGYNLTNEETGSIEYESAVKYVITYPDGKEEVINNLQGFCLKNNLNTANMRGILLGKRTHHKKFKARYLHKENIVRQPKWLIVTPDAKDVLVHELTEFCKLHKLQYNSLLQTSHNLKSIQHKGYRCYLLEAVLNNTQQYPKCDFTYKVIDPNNNVYLTNSLIQLGNKLNINGKYLSHSYRQVKNPLSNWKVNKLINVP